MTIVSHFATGAAICRYVKWRPAGLALAFASHFALDGLPHFEHARLLPPAWQAVARWTPRILSLLIPVLMWVLWRRFRFAPVRGVALYLILGGLLACLPDGLFTVFGHHSLPGLLNDLPHRLWAPAYRRTIAEHGLWSPLAAPLTIGAELAVLAVSGWLLVRPTRHVPTRSGGTS